MYKILIIEDDLVMAGAIKKRWKRGEMKHVMWKILQRFLRHLQSTVTSGAFGYHASFYNGYHWCSEIRKISSVPVIFISSAADNMNIIMAMNMGGDDLWQNRLT